MEDVHIKLCHICLITNVKMYDLRVSPLDTYFLQIVAGNAFISYSTTDLLPYACYECVAMLKKYNEFREKCMLTQTILYGLADSNGKISPKKVQSIDRKEYRVASNLIHTHVTEESAINYSYDEAINSSIKITDFNVYEPSKVSTTDSVKEENELIDLPILVNGYEYTITKNCNQPLCDSEEEFAIKTEVEEMRVDSDDDKGNDNNDVVNNSYDSENVDRPKESKIVIATPKMTRSKRDSGNRNRKTNNSRAKKTNPSQANKTNTLKIKKKIASRTTKTNTSPSKNSTVHPEADLLDYVNIKTLTLQEQMDEINKRQHSTNYLNSPFRCDLCYKGFLDTDTWQNHVSRHAPSAGEKECPVCRLRFKTKSALHGHAYKHTKKYSCKTCSYVSRDSTQARRHVKWHKGVKYKCQYCDEIMSKWTSYMSHVRIKHPSEFVCSVCGYSFVSQHGLTMHKSMMHKDHVDNPEDDDKSTGHYCKECDVLFVSIDAWKRHLVMSVKHTGSKDSIKGCRTCGETFDVTGEARHHCPVYKEHPRKQTKSYKKPTNDKWPAKCEHCPEMILNARRYWAHFRRVHPDLKYPIKKDYVCDVCGKAFKWNALLQYHKRLHTEDRPFKCAQCGKAFYSRTNLDIHETSHSDSRPFPCPICPKAFKSKGALERHSRIHTGLKPFECEICGKRFSQSNSRKGHVKAVHMKQPAPYAALLAS